MPKKASRATKGGNSHANHFPSTQTGVRVVSRSKWRLKTERKKKGKLARTDRTRLSLTPAHVSLKKPASCSDEKLNEEIFEGPQFPRSWRRKKTPQQQREREEGGNLKRGMIPSTVGASFKSSEGRGRKKKYVEAPGTRSTIRFQRARNHEEDAPLREERNHFCVES